MKFGFKKINHPDKIFMKKIIIDIKPKPKEMDILQDNEITVDIKDKNISFYMIMRIIFW